jgi:ferredoxin-NADP reductase/Na+-translocating ferredoxin:NAD+ oxidoreductase RnfD subunit
MWLQLLKPVDKLVDGISMYRLLLYYLIGLVIAAIVFSATGSIHYNPLQIGVSAVTLVLACWLINKVFGYIFNAPVNPESSILTGLILCLIIPPTLSGNGFLFLLAASGLAMASKYLLTIRNKHIFNPAAIAVVLTALGPRQTASWWVGTAVMLPFVLAGGLLVMRKVRREQMVLAFLLATTAATALFSSFGGQSALSNLHNMLLSSCIFFLGFVMLTEPYTSPTTRGRQLSYAVLVGILVAPQAHLLHFYTTPEIALVLGNIYAYLVSPKTKLFPILHRRLQIAAQTLEFSFVPDRKLAYQPGQYMEWTLPHAGTDSRGARRWFTLASSPTEERLLLGVKFYKQGSSYKEAMLEMDQNTPVVAAQLAGDFVMPKDKSRKLVFIAGGIGITPFRSMVKYLVDTKQQRSVRLLYAARTQQDFAYQDVFEAARSQLGIQTLYVASEAPAASTSQYTVNGIIDAALIQRMVPDFSDCLFYISGTHAMVNDLHVALKELGVHHGNIKIDFFPGYA